MKNTVEEKVRENEEQKSLDRKGLLQESVKKTKDFLKKAARGFFEKYSVLLGEELEKERLGTRERVRVLSVSIILCVLSIILSATAMGESTYPVSLAVLCASGCKKKIGVFVPRLAVALSLASVCIATLFMEDVGVLYFSVFIFVFVLRSVFTSASFSERVSVRCLMSLASAFLTGVLYALVSDFALLSLVSWVTLVCVTPIFTFLFTALYDRVGRARLDTKESERFFAGILSVAFLTVLSLGEIKIFYLSLSLLLSTCATLYMSKRYGGLKGALVGTALGIACSSPVYSAVLGIVGAMSSLFFPRDLYALTVSVLVSTVVSVFTGGSEGFLTTLPEVLLSSLVMFPILVRTRAVLKSIALPKTPKEKNRIPRDRLERLSGAFSGLSEVFFAVGERQKEEGEDEWRRKVTYVVNTRCASCTAAAVCHGRHAEEFGAATDELSLSSTRNDVVTKEALPKHFKERCVYKDEICADINREKRMFLSKHGNLDEVNLIAGEYRTVSKLLKSTAENFSSDPNTDERISREVVALLERLGIEYGFVEAWGGRNTVIDTVGIRHEKITLTSLDIVSAFENALGMKFEEPEFILEDSVSVLRMKRRRSVHLECAKNTCGKKGETTNGDTVSFFENDTGMFYSLICDGMGSGREAALTSRLASVFLEKLLSCAGDKSVSIEMLNRMLLKCDTEVFTTLDLVEIDLYRGKASFVKVGASPSFVYRGGKVYTVSSKTPPVGIIEDISAEETGITLRGGDIIVLLSDGVADNEDFPISRIVSENRTLSASDLSKKILSLALSRFSARDDMSVAVIKVFED